MTLACTIVHQAGIPPNAYTQKRKKRGKILRKSNKPGLPCVCLMSSVQVQVLYFILICMYSKIFEVIAIKRKEKERSRNRFVGLATTTVKLLREE